MSIVLEACQDLQSWPAKWRAVAICLAKGMTDIAIQRAGVMNATSISRARHRGTSHFSPDEFQMAVLRLQEAIFGSCGHWLSELDGAFRTAKPKASQHEILLTVSRLLELVANQGPGKLKGNISLEGTFDPEVINAGGAALSKLFEMARYQGNGDSEKGTDGSTDTDQTD